ncbi:unnamed protein product [Trichobilharzia szidati]|nr:unnamed protein product [Trichobilharzia szidati]
MSSVQCVDQKSSGSDSSSTGEEERLKQLFLSCDSNNDGCLNCEDLYDMCRKLNMAECAEEIINTLGANTKGNITFDEFLSCREKVFRMQTEADTMYFTKPNSTQHQNFKQCGTNWPTYTHDRSLGRNQKCVDERSSNSFHKLHENTNLGSSASETSLGNSGAEYDSGAQDLCGEPQSLHLLLQRDFADLYNVVFPFLNNTNLNNPYKRESHTIPDDSILLPKPNTIENGDDNINNNTTKNYTNKELINTINFHSKEKLNNHVKPVKMELSNVQLTSESNPYLIHVRNLFECANTLHIQRTAQLRSEIRDLSHRLQGLQTSRDMSYREIQRLQKEKEQLRNELTNQISRYEDRLTELHSVIAELQRRLKHSESNIIHEVEEFEDNEVDDEEEEQEQQEEDEEADAVNRSESDKKLCKKRLDNHSKLSVNNSINQYNESNMSEISDTSVDAIMDDDDE